MVFLFLWWSPLSLSSQESRRRLDCEGLLKRLGPSDFGAQNFQESLSSGPTPGMSVSGDTVGLGVSRRGSLFRPRGC